MLSEKNQSIIREIERIRDIIVEDINGHYHFVCNYADDGRYYREIRSMVISHIGRENTMVCFLRKKWKMEVFEVIPYEVYNSYRICMLNNMIKMVQEGKYRG